MKREEIEEQILTLSAQLQDLKLRIRPEAQAAAYKRSSPGAVPMAEMGTPEHDALLEIDRQIAGVEEEVRRLRSERDRLSA